MNLKKTIAAFAVSAALVTGAVAENHPYGMDIALGVVGVEYCSATFKEWGSDLVLSHNVIDIFPLKVNTYICPWLDNHLGIYGSIGFLPGVYCNNKIKARGAEFKSDSVGFNFGVEFMVGPAFGVDLGESSVRFQIGAPFHFLVGCGAMVLDTDYRTVSEIRNDAIGVTFSAFGLGLTPQFRFAANKRCSFVVGMDFVFDFVYNETWEADNITDRGNGVYTDKFSPTAGADSTFRFGWIPYLGVGINFGN